MLLHFNLSKNSFLFYFKGSEFECSFRSFRTLDQKLEQPKIVIRTSSNLNRPHWYLPSRLISSFCCYRLFQRHRHPQRKGRYYWEQGVDQWGLLFLRHSPSLRGQWRTAGGGIWYGRHLWSVDCATSVGSPCSGLML